MGKLTDSSMYRFYDSDIFWESKCLSHEFESSPKKERVGYNEYGVFEQKENLGQSLSLLSADHPIQSHKTGKILQSLL